MDAFLSTYEAYETVWLRLIFKMLSKVMPVCFRILLNTIVKDLDCGCIIASWTGQKW